MKALIIAAGEGKRLQKFSKDKPKPLIQFLGLSLIERVVLTANQFGIKEFVIVIGYQGEKIKEKLGDGERYGVKITYVENGEWKKGNGVSVLKARDLLEDNFILLMADHIFDASILRDLKDRELEKDECVLCVDTTGWRDIDLEDATKVRIENERIVDIGKELKEFNAVDCGIFLLSPSIFDMLEKNISEGYDSLSDSIKGLAAKGKMRFFDIGDRFWFDIDTKESYRKAEKLLLKRLTKPTDGPVSKYLNRRISTKISKFLVKTSLKPNTVSFISFFVSLLSAFFFSAGNYLYVLAGGMLAQFSSVIDGCDGEVARLTFQKTEYGAWFDAVLDRYADGLIVLGMMYGWWRLHGGWEIWVIGFIAVIGGFINSYMAVKHDQIFMTNSGKSKVRLGRDLRLFLIMIGGLCNQIMFSLIIIGVLTNAESIRRLYVLRGDTLKGS